MLSELYQADLWLRFVKLSAGRDHLVEEDFDFLG